MSLASNISDVVTQIGAKIKALTGRVATLEASGTGNLVVVENLPASPEKGTVYVVNNPVTGVTGIYLGTTVIVLNPNATP